MDVKRLGHNYLKQPDEFELTQKNSAIDHHKSSGNREDVHVDVHVESSNPNSSDNCNNEPSISAIDEPEQVQAVSMAETSSVRPRLKSLKHAYQEKESRATWLIYGMLTVLFVISCAYFVNQTVVYERTIHSCSELINQECHQSHCYSGLLSLHIDTVNCNSNETEVFSGTLYCYIVRDIIEASMINELVETVVFFYITGVGISAIFHAVKFLLNFYLTKLWSLLVVLIGTVLFLIVLSVFILIFHTDTHMDILLFFNFLRSHTSVYKHRHSSGRKQEWP